MQQQDHKHVVILGYESSGVPFAQTAIDLLTQGFRDKALSLGTYIWVHNASQTDDYDEAKHTTSLTCIDHAEYVKKMINNTDQLTGISADLMIILCHGAPRRYGKCAQLRFADNDGPSRPYRDECNVDARKMTANVSLKELTSATKLVLMLCCHGNQIMTDYLSDSNTLTRPFILASNQALILRGSIDAILIVLFNILETIVFYTERPILKSQHWARVLIAINRLFQIVKLFGDDHDSFWTYLLQTGVVTIAHNHNRRRQVPSAQPASEALFHVYGRNFNFLLEESTKANTLRDFKTLLLVGPNGPPQSADTAADLVPYPDEHVDVYLKLYIAQQAAKAEATRRTPSPPARDPRDTTLPYEAVEHTAPVHNVPLDDVPPQNTQNPQPDTTITTTARLAAMSDMLRFANC